MPSATARRVLVVDDDTGTGAANARSVIVSELSDETHTRPIAISLPVVAR